MRQNANLPACLHPRSSPAARVSDVLHEQFEVVMDSEGEDSRYLAIRAILLAPFSEERAAMGAGARA